MANEQAILELLNRQRSAVEQSVREVSIEYEKIADKRNILNQQLSSLDVVIQLFGVGNPITEKASHDEPQANEPRTPSNNGHRNVVKGQRGGLKDTVRTHFGELPQEYDKRHIESLISSRHKGLKGKVNQNTLSGIMRHLVEKGLARVKVSASGRSAQVYEKI